MNSFFYDTYALFEIARGNPTYLPYSSNISIMTTHLQLMELYYSLLRTISKEQAERYYDLFVSFAHPLDDETIKEAMQFRLLHKNKGLSYVDCIGYIMAKQRGIPFLTGDKEFEHLPGVKFVK